MTSWWCAAAAVMLAQELTLPAVLARAGVYVNAFHEQFAGIVAEERYLQDAVTPAKKPLVVTVTEHRELLSDLLLVELPRTREWLQFRDVFEVDGKPVRDRDERLTRLFVRPTGSVQSQIEKILGESARYNVGAIERNVNAPVLPLMFLEPANQRRFTFKRSRDRTPAPARGRSAGAAFRVDAEVWVIEYEEKARPTFIRSAGFQSMPAHGRFWIEPSTGRVLMSELVLRDRNVRATIDVSYQSAPLVGFMVPIEMREQYEARDQSRITGVATYGRFRQFQVDTNETFLIKR